MSGYEHEHEREHDHKPKPEYVEIKPHSRSRGVATECCGCIITPIIATCGIICCLIIIVLVILSVIAAVNVSVCNKLNQSVDINTVTPSVFTYDPNTFPNLNFIAFNSIMTKTGKIYISQSNTTSDTNVTVSVRIIASKDETASVKEESDNSTKKISIERSDAFKGKLAWLGYLSLPPRCILAKVEVVLPQKIPSVTEIDTDVNDIIFNANSVPYSSQINAVTLNGELTVNNLAVGGLTLSTKNGDITGSVSGIVSELTASTNNGKIQLNILIGSNATSPKVETTTSNGDIQLGFNSSYAGIYDAKTSNGKVDIINATADTTNKDNEKSGSVGSGNATLVADTKNGDINITF